MICRSLGPWVLKERAEKCLNAHFKCWMCVSVCLCQSFSVCLCVLVCVCVSSHPAGNDSNASVKCTTNLFSNPFCNDDNRNIAQEIKSWPPRLKNIILSSHRSTPNPFKPWSSEWRVWSSDIVLEKLNDVLKEQHITKPLRCPTTERAESPERVQSPFESRPSISECHDPYFS